LNQLAENGFMKIITENFKDLIDEAKAKGLRDFEVYGMTETAYQMFNPKEGQVN